MRFSDQFGIVREEWWDWFDPVLSIDTKLFIDPFLLYGNEQGMFIGSHAEILAFFNYIFTLIARTGGNRNHLHWKLAQASLVFPEVEELCLGYASGSTKGSGSGKGFSRIIAGALWEAVEAGIDHFSHFEEVGILRGGIGADRISDITANALRHRFAKYTSDICTKIGLETRQFQYERGIYDLEFGRWARARFNLPMNPYNGCPILLCPADYLRDLPTISAENFWDYCYSNENETLRNEFGADITRNVDKKTIIEFARGHAKLRKEFISHVEEEGGLPYDYGKDRRGENKVV